MFGKTKKLREALELLQQENKELRSLLAETRSSLVSVRHNYVTLFDKFKALQKESEGYVAKLEHINKLNRERQRRYRRNNRGRA